MTNVVDIAELLDLEEQANNLYREILAVADKKTKNSLVQSIAFVLALATALEGVEDQNGDPLYIGDFVYSVMNNARKETSQ